MRKNYLHISNIILWLLVLWEGEEGEGMAVGGRGEAREEREGVWQNGVKQGRRGNECEEGRN